MVISFLSTTLSVIRDSAKYLIICSVLLLISCKPLDKKDASINQKVEPDLTFTCVYEKDMLPPIDSEADHWFKHARKLEKVNQYQRDYTQIGELYRKAAERNHPKAMLNLGNLISYGKVAPLAGKGPAQEAWDIARKMATLNISYGYYQMGNYLDTGYGVNRDRTRALAYFRQAADLGNSEAQFVIGDIFLSKRLDNMQDNPAYSPDIGKKMLDCATQQQHGKAAYYLATYYLDVDEDLDNGMKYHQLAIKNGYRASASALAEGFKPNIKEKSMYYLPIKPDLERSARYESIKLEIRNNPEARFPDIDKIVPLPPAELPEWDGTFEYKKQQISQ
ncbi:DUF6396 domain-containing protein [Proteus sp. TJ1640]|uniref:SEL1-like repeat protein n=1 Tax=Proteus sp. TJ1640 TaxID=2050968 RepID=UPI000D69486D|nr:DUF6396 domain-containing protein [Proteus sp. TJ1640]